MIFDVIRFSVFKLTRFYNKITTNIFLSSFYIKFRLEFCLDANKSLESLELQ